MVAARKKPAKRSSKPKARGSRGGSRKKATTRKKAAELPASVQRALERRVRAMAPLMPPGEE